MRKNSLLSSYFYNLLNRQKNVGVVDIGVIALTILVRLVYVIYISRKLGLVETSDHAYYHQIAGSIAGGEGYPQTAFSMPLYPIFLSMVYYIFGYSLLVGRVANAVLSGISVFLLMQWTSKLSTRRVSIISGIIYALFPSFITFTGFLALENIYIPLLLCLLLLFSNFIEKRSWTKVFQIGIISGLMLLTRPESLILLFMLSIYFLYISSEKRSTAVIQIVGITAVALVILSPWTIRNYKVFGKFIPFTDSGGATLYVGNNAYYRGGDPVKYYDKLFPPEYYTEMIGVREPERDTVYREKVINWITTNPGTFLSMIPVKIGDFWDIRVCEFFRDSTSNPYLERWLPVSAIMFLIITGWTGILYMPHSHSKTIFFILFFVNHLIAATFFGYERLRLPLAVTLCAMSAYGVLNFSRLFYDIKSLKLKSLIRPLIFILILIFLAAKWSLLLSEYLPRLKGFIT